jgi:Amt family ammonium transporter
VVVLKRKLRYDDALDTFGVHAVGGTVGTLLTGLLAVEGINGQVGGMALLMKQLGSVAIVVVWSVVATAILAYAIKATIGLRPSDDVERQGLDINEHGEEGYAD